MKTIGIVFSLLTLVFLIISFMSAAANRKTERQQYNVIKQENGFEIRFYPKALMATLHAITTDKHGNKNNNFRTLAGYIFGGNKDNTKIAMTAPVYMGIGQNADKMSFVLPAQYKINELPQPNDTSIDIHYSEEGYYAAYSFGGFSSNDKIEKKENELKELLTKCGYEVVGPFYYLGYNAPWDMVNRENDILVKIKYTK